MMNTNTNRFYKYAKYVTNDLPFTVGRLLNQNQCGKWILSNCVTMIYCKPLSEICTKCHVVHMTANLDLWLEMQDEH